MPTNIADCDDALMLQALRKVSSDPFRTILIPEYAEDEERLIYQNAVSAGLLVENSTAWDAGVRYSLTSAGERKIEGVPSRTSSWMLTIYRRIISRFRKGS